MLTGWSWCAGPPSKLAGVGCVALLAVCGTAHAQHAVPLFVAADTAAGVPERQGFVRIVNHDDRAGEAHIVAFDDAGVRRGPIRLALPAGETVHFNSNDLQDGNPSKGIAAGVGAPTLGDWRLEITSTLDIAVLAYLRTRDGFLTNMRDVAPAVAEGIKVAIFNPASNRNQVSRLRLINPTTAPAAVRIRAVDDRGRVSAVVSTELPARAARTFTAQELEGTEESSALQGSLGNGDGKWRLTVTADQPVQAMSLLASPTGHITNLSTVPRQPGATAHRVPLFPAAAAADATVDERPFRQGFLRIVNRAAAGVVTITAFDESPLQHEPVSLPIGAGATVHINSDDLEHGNAAKGLSAGVGDGVGDWRLELQSDSNIEVLAYIRTKDGFLTSMHEQVARLGDSYRVATFNPASNVNQVSTLRIANPGDVQAHVAIVGVDDRGAPGGPVRLTIPAGGVRTLAAADLETGVGVAGALGDGAGKWQLTVQSAAAIDVASLIQNRTGHLTNLSSEPERSAAAFYQDRLSMQVVQSRCINCHIAGGVAEGTRLVFAAAQVLNHAEMNHGVFRNFVANADRASLVLTKVRGEADHGGGLQLADDSPEYASLRTYLDRLVDERLPPPSPPARLQLIDAIPRQGAEIDPATRNLSLVHLDGADSTFGYAGSCRPSGVAVRRSLVDLSDGAIDVVDHHVSCDLTAASRQQVHVDALGAEGGYRQGELSFTTGNDLGGLSLIVRDSQFVPRGAVDELFHVYITAALLDDIEDSSLRILAGVLLDALAEDAWAELRDPNASYGVLTERVAYRSRTPEGTISTLTGLVAAPAIDDESSFERRNRVLVLSHATGSTPSALEFSDPWYVLAVMFASRGYLVIAPDNWGRGELRDATLPETYLLANRTANNSLDMLRAVLASDDYRDFHAAQTDLALIGYSQGGHTAMALWLAIHAAADDDLRVRELHSGAAPHNLYRTFRGALEQLAGRCDDAAYCRLVDRGVISQYAVGRIIPAVLAYAPGDLTRADLVEDDALRTAFVTGMLDDDPRYDAMKTTLQRSSFTNLVDLSAAIAADTSIHLYHSPFDRLVPQQNTRDLAALLAPDFNVTFYEDECASDGYEVLFGIVTTAGPLHAVCGMEVLDEVLKSYR